MTVGELVVGRVLSVEEHPGARAPSLLLTVDLGVHGRHEVVLPTGDYAGGDLLGAQVLCRREADDVRVAGAHSHASGLVLLRPDRKVEDGTVVD